MLILNGMIDYMYSVPLISSLLLFHLFMYLLYRELKAVSDEPSKGEGHLIIICSNFQL